MLGKRSAGTLSTTRIPVEWPATDNFRILSIDGGGIRGILPAAILSELEQSWLQGRSVGQYFDLIAGTSTGGIIALGLASGLTATEILSIYMDKGRDIFPPHGRILKTWKGIKQIVGPKSDVSALYSVIDETFKEEQFWQTKNRLCIPSMDGTFGEVFIYKTPHHPDYRKDWKEKKGVIAKATSAAPTYFPALKNAGYTMIDGGVWANNPIMLALVDTLATCNVPRGKIRILSLGCVKENYVVAKRKAEGGLWRWRDVFYGASNCQSQDSLGQAGLLIGRQNLLRLDCEPLPEKIAMDDWQTSKEMLPGLGKKICEDVGQQVNEMFFYEEVKPFVPLYTPSNPPFTPPTDKHS